MKRVSKEGAQYTPAISLPHRRVPVVTVVDPALRRQVDAVSNGCFNAFHAASVSEALEVLEQHGAHTLLLSPEAVERDQLPSLGRVVARRPGILPIAVISEPGAGAPARLLELGAWGIRKMLDFRDRESWLELRRVIAEPSRIVAERIFDGVVPHLGKPSVGSSAFFRLIVQSAPTITTVMALAHELGVVPSTLMSRFFRASLPSPKRYLALTRVMFARAYLDDQRRSIADVALDLRYSSPQSFGRHVQTLLGMTASALREQHSFDAVLAHYIGRLVEPFTRKFEWFNPLGCAPDNPLATE